jgi:hypothetical protein
MVHDRALMIHRERYNQQVHIHIYVNLLCYKQRNLLHVSFTYCGHLQGGVLEGGIT